MWVVTNKGFFSVVAKDEAGKPSGKDPNSIVSVRFRRPQDAKALFPGHKLVMTAGGDYACRVFATRVDVFQVLMHEVLGMDYQNFKSSIPRSDGPLHDAAMQAWSVFGQLQDGGPYGNRPAARSPYWAVGDPLGCDWPYAEDRRSLFDDLPGYGDARGTGVGGTGKRKARKARKIRTSSRDPFCIGCGVRFGAENLDEQGLCTGCLEDVALSRRK